MKMRWALFVMLLCAGNAFAVTILSSDRSIRAVSPAFTCEAFFPNDPPFSFPGDTRSSSSTTAGSFSDTVTSTSNLYGYGSAGQTSLLGNTGIEITSMFAGVSSTDASCLVIAAAGARSSRAQVSVSFTLDAPMNYTFTGQLSPQSSFGSGFSGIRSYGLSFNGQGFSAQFFNSEPFGNLQDGFVYPYDPRSIDVSGSLPEGTHTFSAWIENYPEGPPSLSAGSRFDIAASLRFSIPEPCSALLLLLSAGMPGRRRMGRA